MFDLATATLATFAPHVDTPFVLDHPEMAETFTLVQAAPLPAQGQGRDGFVLFFEGGRTDVQFDQQVLPLTHAAIGPLALFLVPVARNPQGTIRYQAVFN